MRLTAWRAGGGGPTPAPGVVPSPSGRSDPGRRQAEVFEIEGDGGHLDGLLAIGKAGEAIRAFLAR